MKHGEGEIDLVKQAARRGAQAVAADRRLVADAVEFALHKWEGLVMQGRAVVNLSAWAFRIGSNAAKRLGASQARTRGEDLADLPEAAEFEAEGQPVSRPDSHQRVLRAWLSRHGENLTRGRQLEVVRKLARSGMTFHRAAKELRMDRSNLRRTFQRALRRLARR